MKCHKRKATCYSVSTQRANLPKHKKLVPVATPKLVQQVGVSSKAGELSVNTIGPKNFYLKALGHPQGEEKKNDGPSRVETNLPQIGLLNCP